MPDEPDDDLTIPPLDADEELLHAYIDGEASTDERARVEGDPALLARLEAVRAMRSDVRAASNRASRAASPSTRARSSALASPSR